MSDVGCRKETLELRFIASISSIQSCVIRWYMSEQIWNRSF